MADLKLYQIAQAVLLFAVVVSLALLLFYLVRKLRDDDGEDYQNTSDLLTKFRDLHAEGVLSDEEYRTIKAKLAARIQEELKDSEETG